VSKTETERRVPETIVNLMDCPSTKTSIVLRENQATSHRGGGLKQRNLGVNQKSEIHLGAYSDGEKSLQGEDRKIGGKKRGGKEGIYLKGKKVFQHP